MCNDIYTWPPDKPHQDFSNQSEIWRTKVLHGYQPGVAQGTHHFGEICGRESQVNYALPNTCLWKKFSLYHSKKYTKATDIIIIVTMSTFRVQIIIFHLLLKSRYDIFVFLDRTSCACPEGIRWLNWHTLFTMFLWKQNTLRGRNKDGGKSWWRGRFCLWHWKAIFIWSYSRENTSTKQGNYGKHFSFPCSPPLKAFSLRKTISLPYFFTETTCPSTCLCV